MHFLYRYKKNDDKPRMSVNSEEYYPKIGKRGGVILPGESKSIKLIGKRLLFQVMTLGKAKMYYIFNGRNLVHTSYVVSKCRKFPFMGKDDYEIGPCFTDPQYRGQGIYPSVLCWICNSIGNDNTAFYMIVDESNTSSIRGIEKAGFKKCGIVKIAGFTRRYLLKEP